jgi:DNA repair exonuclease SbcCD nuclease subunit
MRIVVISDLHGDRSTLGHLRTAEVAMAVKRAREHAIDHGADVFVCLGDVADPDTGGSTFRAMEIVIETALALRYRGIPSIWVAGNHDVYEDGSGATCLSPLAAVERAFRDHTGELSLIHVAEQPKLVDIEDVSFACLPYTPVSHKYDPAEAAADCFVEAQQKRVVVLGHLMIPGVVPGEETTEMPRGREVLFPLEQTSRAALRLNGHYHHRQTTAEGIVIPGSLCRFTFADENHEPGFLVIDL